MKYWTENGYKETEMIYKKGMLVKCRKTGKIYDPMVELYRLLEENKEVFIRLKDR
jgi:hypothetical protein